MHSIRLHILQALVAASASIDRAYRLFSSLRSEFLVAAVPEKDWLEFNISSINRNGSYLSSIHNDRIFDWEKRAIERYFPPPPARILVGAAGGGREIKYLADMGYFVAGFEPSPKLVSHAKNQVLPEQLLGLEIAAYEDFTNGMPNIEALAPFDAVILGWGSIHHLGLPQARQAVLGKLRALCPAGPVLLSWLKAGPPGARKLMLKSLLTKIGLTHGRANKAFWMNEGFIHFLSRDDIAAMARSAGYGVAFAEDCLSYPHAVLNVEKGSQ